MGRVHTAHCSHAAYAGTDAMTLAVASHSLVKGDHPVTVSTGRMSATLGLFIQAVAALSLAAETREFSLEEGTWMAVDVAPAGDELLFELLGDIYRLPTAGGEAEPLLVGSAFQSQPRFAPDGSSIAYISDGSGSDNVWLADADGSNARALSDLPRALMWSPAWSADGSSVYVSVTPGDQPRAAEIWRFDVGTGAGERVVENSNGRAAFLVSSPAPGAFGPVPTPDGRALLYTSVTPRPYGSRQGPQSRIVRRDLATGAETQVSVDAPLPMRPLLSADGSTLVYSGESQGKTGIKVRELESGVERWLAHPVQRNQLEGRGTRGLLPQVALTPDGKTLFAAFGGKLRRIDVATGATQIVPFRATASLDIAPRLHTPRSLGRDRVTARRFQDLAGSKDGRLAFSTLSRIFVLDELAAEPRRLTSNAQPREFMPSLSPDGGRVAFVTWDAEGGHLFVADVANGPAAPRRISTRPALYADPAFTPDGRFLVALRAPLGSGRGGRVPDDAALVEFDLDPARAENPARVVNTVAGGRHPHFDPERPEQILLSGATGLVGVHRVDGTREKVVAAPPGPPSRWLRGDGQVLSAGRAGLNRFDVPPGEDPDASEPGAATRIAPVVDTVAWAGGRACWIVDRDLSCVDSDAGTEPESRRLELSVPRARPEGTMILTGARVITMRGDEILENADILVEGERIRAVGAAGSIERHPGSAVIDLAGKTVVPGFIDVHAHGMPPGDLLEPVNADLLANLSYGVTTIRNPQSPPSIFALADSVEAEGAPSPRIESTGPGIRLSFFGAGGNYLAPPFGSLDEVRAELRRYRDDYGTRLLKSYLVGNRQQRQWVIQASRELGMMPTTEGGADTKANMTHAMDGYTGNEHAFPVAPIYDDLVQLVAASGMTYAPTAVVSFGAALPVYRLLAEERPHLEARYARWFGGSEVYERTSRRLLAFPEEAYGDREMAAGAAAIIEAGGHVAIGGHGEAQGLSFHWEMELLADGGMHNHDVVRAATWMGAETMGLEGELGSIEVGKLADLVVLERDPLADIRSTKAISHVMRGGVLYDARTMERLGPQPEAAPDPWWLPASPSESDAARTLEERIDRTVLEIMDATRIPGVGIGVVENGEVRLAKGYGVARLENDVPATAETMFQSGSVGKQFTAAGIMAAVEDGLLSLDDTLRGRFGRGPEQWSQITVRHLLTHSSGIPDYTSDAFDYRRDYSNDDLVEMAAELELEFPAGSRWNYSNTGYVLLGILLSDATGMPYYEYLRERIFDPAGMPTIRVISEPDVIHGRARGYLPGPDGWTHAQWVAPALNQTADGAMLMSVHDMIAWHETVRSRRVLSEESWSQILSPMTLTSGRTYPYGFAWFFDEINGNPRQEHGGAWQGFTAQFTRFPEQDLGLIVLSNARSFGTQQIAEALAALIDPELERSPPPTTPIDDPSPETAQRVADVLAEAGAGRLALDDFAFVRQTIFPRIRAAAVRALDGRARPDRLELLARERVGDDWMLQYYAWYTGEDGDTASRLRVSVGIAPNGGLTALRLREEPPGAEE